MTGVFVSCGPPLQQLHAVSNTVYNYWPLRCMVRWARLAAASCHYHNAQRNFIQRLVACCVPLLGCSLVSACAFVLLWMSSTSWTDVSTKCINSALHIA